ncbi:hypothetical protein [Serratia marcescens]|uniref:hypothetical protein n=1 Tax=Serratia marcescens TaxID=615 RepID=UPI003F41E886
MNRMKGDILDMEKINSLPHPLYVKDFSGWWWLVYDIEVQLGLVRIDVSGMPQIDDLIEYSHLKDTSGKIYKTDEFYLDYDDGEAK